MRRSLRLTEGDIAAIVADPVREEPMMRAEFDSQADALQIDLGTVDRVDHDEDVAPGCTFSVRGDVVVGVEMMSPATHLHELAGIAVRYGLDGEALESAARAALASPDRVVVPEVKARAAA